MPLRVIRFTVAALAATLFSCSFTATVCVAANLQVTRATLSNGLRVIVVHDPLAPVVTTTINYRVGSDDQFEPGLAHATEHMMFRGSKTLSSNQLMDAIGVTGGDFDADTQSEITQFYFTVPAQYLPIALRLERSRATGLSMAQDQWNQERLAITQEVTRDYSDAIYRLFVKMEQRIVGGTPYANDGLGSVYGFAHLINAPQLKKFYATWYHPNNATYVIVGDVDGPSTVAEVKALFGDIPAAKLPARAPVVLQPLRAALYHDTSDQPFTAVLLGYRMPGYDSPDYAAGQILADVLNSQRGNLYALAADGKAYGTEFDVQSYPKTSIGVALASVPTTTKAEDADAMVRAVINGYVKDGFPGDLVQAAKLREISQLEFAGNSIEDLAFAWSQAIAVQNLQSPDDMIAQFKKVTTADVDRVARTYLLDDKVVAAYAVPKNAGVASYGGGPGKEDNNIPPSKHEPLPSWAQSVLDHLRVPPQTLAPVSMTLSNGIRLIVQRETITHTVVVNGEILNRPQVQEPVGKDGVADVTSSLLPYGTTTYGRLAFQSELDKIGATTQAGTEFGVQVLSDDFDRGVALLADEELHPAFAASDFAIVKRQEAQSVADQATTPDHLSEVALVNALYPPGDSFRRFAAPSTVASITLDDVKAWYASAYRPDLTTIVVIGEVTPQAARATFEKYFAGWRASGPTPNVYPSPVPNNVASSVVIPATGRQQSTTQLAETIGLRRSDPDWANMEVANTVLTGGFYSSLLYHDLREVHGYVYSISSSVEAGKVRSSFNLEYGSDPKNIDPAQAQILAILAMLREHPIEATRLLRAKALLMGEVPIGEASYDGVSNLLLRYATQGLPLDQNLLDARRELAADAPSVQRALATWIRTGDFVRIVTGPGPR